MSVRAQKQAAAEYAARLVEDGMTVGLGSGSTAALVVEALGKRVAAGLHVSGVPTSERTAELARSLHIPLVTLEEHSRLDMVIDGADEVDPHLNLIKGHGGALLREKIVAKATNHFVIVVDESKLVTHLGEKVTVPVEVIPFGWSTTEQRLERLGFHCELRGGQNPYRTDSHNYILDCKPTAGTDLAVPETADNIKVQTGVVEQGLFLGMATLVVVGLGANEVQLLRRPE